MPDSPASQDPIVLIACGILEKEIRHLIAANGWRVTPFFLPSGLHTDFGRLRGALERSLSAHAGPRRVVFYGACHPMMDTILTDAQTVRTPGQNCIDIYLGPDVFARELARGAFFLFEDWALRWDSVIGDRSGMPPVVMREIFGAAHEYLLCIRTPCSGDYSAQAEDIGQRTGLPLRWMDVGLDRLQRTLASAIERAAGVAP